MAKIPTRKKTPAKKAHAKKTSRIKRIAPLSTTSSRVKPDRSVAKVKCGECGAAKGNNHDVDCPNDHCVECRGTLGHMLTCSHHPNYRGPVLDGKTGAVLETTVDGKEAKIDTSAKPKPSRSKKAAAAPDVDEDDDDEKDDGLKRLAPPKVTDPALFEALQHAIDKKAIFGIKQPLTKSKSCDAEWFDDESNQSVGCAGSAAFDIEQLDTCVSCKHTSKHVIKKRCIAHMALTISGDFKERQIDMFEGAE